MNAARSAMNAALSRAVRAHLRPLGFTGTLPHLRRFIGDCVHLVTFQFSQDGGQFTIPVGICGDEGVNHRSGKHVPAVEANAWDVGSYHRLGGAHPDHWLVFGPRMWEPGVGVAKPAAHYDAIAKKAVDLVIGEGLPYLESACAERAAGSATA